MYKIAIPSYSRDQILFNQTLSTLKRNGIDPSLIYIFVVDDQFSKYSEIDPSLYNTIVIGKKGVVEQRKFITEYFDEGQQILSLDDDLQEIDLQYTDYDSLNHFILDAFRICKDMNSFIWSVNPVFNPFWREKKLPIKKTKLNFCVGAFYGFINRRDPLLQIPSDDFCMQKDDVERSILYYIKDGITVVFNRVGFKTKYYSCGGLGRLNERMNDIILSAKSINTRYPLLTKIKIRNNGIYEIILNKK